MWRVCSASLSDARASGSATPTREGDEVASPARSGTVRARSLPHRNQPPVDFHRRTAAPGTSRAAEPRGRAAAGTGSDRAARSTAPGGAAASRAIASLPPVPGLPPLPPSPWCQRRRLRRLLPALPLPPPPPADVPPRPPVPCTPPARWYQRSRAAARAARPAGAPLPPDPLRPRRRCPPRPPAPPLPPPSRRLRRPCHSARAARAAARAHRGAALSEAEEANHVLPESLGRQVMNHVAGAAVRLHHDQSRAIRVRGPSPGVHGPRRLDVFLRGVGVRHGENVRPLRDLRRIRLAVSEIGVAHSLPELNARPAAGEPGKALRTLSPHC